MSILGHRDKVRNRIVMLTPVGKQKADDYMKDDVIMDIFTYLQDHGASTVSDIARGINKSPGLVERIVDRMVRKHYLQYSNMSED